MLLLYDNVLNGPSCLTGDGISGLAVTTQQSDTPYVKAQTIELPLSLAYKKITFLILTYHLSIVGMYLIVP